MSEEEIAIYDLNSGKVVNNIKPTMEKMFHIELLKNRPELNTVLHFQSPFATTIACLKEKPTDFNVTLEIPIYIGEKIPVIPFLKPGSEEVASAVLSAMSQSNCVILENHGQEVCGRDFKEALQRAVFFEMACRIIVESGGKYKTLSPSEYADFLNR